MAEEKICIVLEGCVVRPALPSCARKEGIAQSMFYRWSKEFLEAGKKRLAGAEVRAQSPKDSVGA